MEIIMYLLAILSVAAVVFMLLKKMDIKITLFGVGIILAIFAMIMGKIEIKKGDDIFYPIQMVLTELEKILPRAGLIILMLGGYTAYMSHIGANDVTVNTLTKPLKKIKSVYILVPLVFLIGNVLSLVVPSASNLAIILLATLYPVLKKAGMSTLTAAGIIATTATVMPTPLGSDNIMVAEEFAKHFNIALSPSTYVFAYHAIVSIPTLFVMAIAHYFWQKYCDKKDALNGKISNEEKIEEIELKEIKGSFMYKLVYTLLPLLPIVILILTFAINPLAKMINENFVDISLTVGVATLISFIFAIFAQLIFNKQEKNNFKHHLEETEIFFKGMGGAMGIVILTVAAGVFVQGLKDIGVVSSLQKAMEQTDIAGWILPLTLVLFTALIVLISGSGTSLFFAMVPLMATLAAAAKINPLAIAIPMGLAGNLLRAVSPVSAVVMIVAGTTKKSPAEIVKRTSLPMVVGVVFMFILSMILFLSGMIALPI